MYGSITEPDKEVRVQKNGSMDRWKSANRRKDGLIEERESMEERIDGRVRIDGKSYRVTRWKGDQWSGELQEVK
jgi:hypothetical protein